MMALYLNWKHIRDTYIYLLWGFAVLLASREFLIGVYKVFFPPHVIVTNSTYSTSFIWIPFLYTTFLQGLCVFGGVYGFFIFRKALNHWDKIGLGLMALSILMFLPEIQVAFYHPRYGYGLLNKGKEVYFSLIGLSFFYASHQGRSPEQPDTQMNSGSSVTADESEEYSSPPPVPVRKRLVISIIIFIIIAVPAIVIWFLHF